MFSFCWCLFVVCVYLVLWVFGVLFHDKAKILRNFFPYQCFISDFEFIPKSFLPVELCQSGSRFSSFHLEIFVFKNVYKGKKLCQTKLGASVSFHSKYVEVCLRVEITYFSAMLKTKLKTEESSSEPRGGGLDARGGSQKLTSMFTFTFYTHNFHLDKFFFIEFEKSIWWRRRGAIERMPFAKLWNFWFYF